jgi:hypothetical protein
MTPSCEKATFFMGSSIGFLFASGRMHEEKKEYKKCRKNPKSIFQKTIKNSTKIMEKRRKKIKLSFCEIF